MDTPFLVLMMIGVAVLLLGGAVIADRRLAQRMDRRLRGEVQDSTRPDAADAVIQLLDRTSSMVRQTVESAGKEDSSD